MLGLSLDKLVVIGAIAGLLIGPQRLPSYAASLARMVGALNDFVVKAKKKVADEVPELTDVDWTKLDPRRYDPRRIVRDALAENDWNRTRSEYATADELDSQH